MSKIPIKSQLWQILILMYIMLCFTLYKRNKYIFFSDRSFLFRCEMESVRNQWFVKGKKQHRLLIYFYSESDVEYSE